MTAAGTPSPPPLLPARLAVQVFLSFAFAHGFLESTNGAAEIGAQCFQLLCAEHEKADHENDEQMTRCEEVHAQDENTLGLRRAFAAPQRYIRKHV